MTQDTTPAATPATPPADPAKGADPEPAAPAAAEPAAPKADTKRDRGTDAARKAELARQADVVEAVADAGANDLPKIGGPMKNPGLGR